MTELISLHLSELWDIHNHHRDKGIKLLCKIYTNILNDPSEPKYRNLNFSKICEKFDKCRPCIYLLYDAGFVESESMSDDGIRLLLKNNKTNMKLLEDANILLQEKIKKGTNNTTTKGSTKTTKKKCTTYQNDNMQSIISHIVSFGITENIQEIQNAMENVTNSNDINEVVDYIFNQQDKKWMNEMQNEYMVNSEKMTENEVEIKTLIINYNNKQIEYEIKSNIDECDNNNYLDLIKSIKNAFTLDDNFSLYELVEGDQVDIDDIDDIKDAFQDETNQNTNTIYLYVKVEYELEWQDLMEGLELEDFNSTNNRSNNVNVSANTYDTKEELAESKINHPYVDPRRLFKATAAWGGSCGLAMGTTVGTEAGILAGCLAAGAGIAVGAVATVWAGHSAIQYWRNYKEDKKLGNKQQHNVKVKLFNEKVKALENIEDIISPKIKELHRQEEKTNNVTFQIERKYTLSSKVVVCIGPTGYGKSLICNRLIGNKKTIQELAESKDAEFDVAALGAIIANTKLLKKFIKKVIIKNKTTKSRVDSFVLSVVDTVGAWDSDHNDEDFQNQMAVYFKESGGINMFCIFFRFGVKWDKNYQQLLKAYTKFFGKTFWKHCVIVITHCDKQNIYCKQGCPLLKKQIKEYLKVFAGNIDIPIFEFGENNFETSTRNLLLSLTDSNTVYIDKHRCDRIISPMDTLWYEIKPLLRQYQRLNRELNSLSRDIQQSESEIE